MTDNLYFLFLDEIYSPNLNNFRKLTKKEIFAHTNHHHFGVTGAIVAASCLYDLDSKARKIKDRYFSKKENFVFHYVDILHDRGDFYELANDKNRKKSFIASLKSFVDHAEFKYICAFVDKHELIKKCWL